MSNSVIRSKQKKPCLVKGKAIVNRSNAGGFSPSAPHVVINVPDRKYHDMGDNPASHFINTWIHTVNTTFKQWFIIESDFSRNFGSTFCIIHNSAQEYDVNKRTSFRGWVSEQDMCRYLSHSVNSVVLYVRSKLNLTVRISSDIMTENYDQIWVLCSMTACVLPTAAGPVVFWQPCTWNGNSPCLTVDSSYRPRPAARALYY